MGHQKIQSKYHRLHRLLWLGVAKIIGGRSVYLGDIVGFKREVFKRLCKRFSPEDIGEATGHSCFACIAHNSWPTKPDATTSCSCPLQWTVGLAKKSGLPCIDPGSEYKSCKTAADARKIAYMKWHERGVNPKQRKPCTQ